VIRRSGRFRSSLIIGVQGIRARKLRTLLSMVSLFLGVLAVVVVQAGAAIAERAMLADLELVEGVEGTRQMYVVPHQGASGVVLEKTRGRSDAVALITTSAVIGEPGVRPINPGAIPFEYVEEAAADAAACYPGSPCDGGEGAPGKVTPPGQAIELRLTAMTGDVRAFRPFRPRSGQWLTFGPIPALSPRIVLNEEAAKGFARYKVPAEMHIQGATANITPQLVGVVDDGSTEPNAYVRLDELTTWLPIRDGSPEGGGGPDIRVLMGPATAVEHVLTAKLRGIGTDAHVNSVQSRKDMEKELALVRLVFLAMAGLVLLIGVAGILNVGLATVGERVEEFALRRAVGTSRSLLAGIVLAETLLTGLLTAAAAIGTGAAALKVVTMVAGGSEPFLQDLVFPWQAGVAGIIAGLVAGLLGGLIPALRAARIPIATVMRA
jgi:putative ABC transport system permease protein